MSQPTVTNTYSDEKLREDIVKGQELQLPGLTRQAEALLTVPQEVRIDISLLSGYIVNTVPGWRPSDATWEAIRTYRIGGIDAVNARMSR